MTRFRLFFALLFCTNTAHVLTNALFASTTTEHTQAMSRSRFDLEYTHHLNKLNASILTDSGIETLQQTSLDFLVFLNIHTTLLMQKQARQLLKLCKSLAENVNLHSMWHLNFVGSFIDASLPFLESFMSSEQSDQLHLTSKFLLNQAMEIEALHSDPYNESDPFERADTESETSSTPPAGESLG